MSTGHPICLCSINSILCTEGAQEKYTNRSKYIEKVYQYILYYLQYFVCLHYFINIITRK